jgi:hypothetical protein
MEKPGQKIKPHISLIIVGLCLPFLLWAVCKILPTHDDWATLTRPTFEPLFVKERWLFYGYHWRPFDSLFGYILGLNPQLIYPELNHFCVILGHALCSYLVFYILTVLKFRSLAINIATLYFFIAPATMATVSAVDSMNQVYALFWGMISFIIYIKIYKWKYPLWIITIYIATLCKENGIMWALIGPCLAYGFDIINWKVLKKDIVITTVLMSIYALLILLLPSDITIADSYVPGYIKSIHNFVKFIFTSFITVDYIYLLHQPHRNLILACISLIPTLPFFYYIYIKNKKLFLEKKMLFVILCLLFAVAPHIFTVFSMMHTYAGMTLLAFMVALGIEKCKVDIKPLTLSFILFCLSAVVINYHLIKSSIESGLIGKQMAQEAINKTGKPVNSVYVIIIEDDYPKLSSFCVIPNEAFGWGLASQYETNYQWPKIISDTTIERSGEALRYAKDISSRILNNKEYECVWIVNGKDINVIKN